MLKDNPFDIASSIVPQHLSHPYNYHYEMMWEAAKAGAAMMRKVMSMRNKVMETGWEDEFKIPSIEERIALLSIETEESSSLIPSEEIHEVVEEKIEEKIEEKTVEIKIPKIKKRRARRKASFLRVVA